MLSSISPDEAHTCILQFGFPEIDILTLYELEIPVKVFLLS